MAKAALNLNSLRFHVAEGSPFFQTILYGILHALGAQHIAVTGNGEDALERCRREQTDLLICDGSLPMGDGFDVVRRIRTDNHNPNRHTPVIVLTSHAQVQTVQHARDCGANFVLAKPLSPKMIYDRLLWIAEDPRAFVIAPGYAGPDRRFKTEPCPLPQERRRQPVAAARPLHAAAEARPAMH